MGRFPQLASGAERDLQWKVLDIDTENHRILMITKKVLLGKPFDATSSRWDQSAIRAWLNDTSENGFIGMTFTAKERARIVEVELDNSATNGGPTGENTTDRVFLLDHRPERANGTCHYFMQTNTYTGTDPCVLNGDAAPWWLRSPGADDQNAAYVDTNGTVASGSVDNAVIGIRPAMYIHYEP